MRGLMRAFFGASAANFTSDRKSRVGADITDRRTQLRPEKLRLAAQATSGLGAVGFNLDAFAELTDEEDRSCFLVAGKVTYAGIEQVVGLQALVKFHHTKEAALRRAVEVYSRYNSGPWTALLVSLLLRSSTPISSSAPTSAGFDVKAAKPFSLVPKAGGNSSWILNPEDFTPPQPNTGLGGFGFDLKNFEEMTNGKFSWFYLSGMITYAGVEELEGVEAWVFLDHTKNAAKWNAIKIWYDYNHGFLPARDLGLSYLVSKVKSAIGADKLEKEVPAATVATATVATTIGGLKTQGKESIPMATKKEVPAATVATATVATTIGGSKTQEKESIPMATKKEGGGN